MGLTSKIISFSISLIFIAWLCTYIFLLKNVNNNHFVISFIFWILSIWLILLGVYISMLGLVWATKHYDKDVEYYAQAFADVFRKPQLSLTALTFWLIIYLIGIRNPILLLLFLPGLLIMVETGIYKKLKERKAELSKKA